MDKKVLKQDLKKESPFRFEFKFKHFPENVADEVIQDVTLKHLFVQVILFLQKNIFDFTNFFFQVKEDILKETVYCPAEKAVFLASYAVQAKFDDYDDESKFFKKS